MIVDLAEVGAHVEVAQGGAWKPVRAPSSYGAV